MKIGYFGTPGISSYCLERLCEKHDILFVVTSVDKPKGRNRILSCSETKDVAECNDIPIFQPVKLKDPDFISEIKKFDADLFVVVAYGKIIPSEVYEMPRLKSINLHPSLLPKYRGAAPINWVLINGEEKTGVTVQLINEEMDAGDIVVQEEFLIDEEMNAAELYEKVLPLGYELLEKAIEKLNDSEFSPIKQDESEATFCQKIDRETAHINWGKNSNEIHNLIRGLNPKPYAWTTFRGKNIKIIKSKLFNNDINEDLKPGQLLKYQKKHLIAGTGSGNLEIRSLQPENKKIMDGLSFVNGYRIESSDFFQ